MTAAGKGRGPSPVDWERLARAEMHPLRVDVLELLRLDGGRTLSASELAYELRMPLGNVDYHVKGLVKKGLVVAVHHHRVRGATEHFYCLDSHDGSDLLDRLPPREDEP